MRRKAIMVDVDGVLITHPHAKGWSVTLEHDLGISPEALQDAFFTPHWDDVVHGRAALRERLAPALADIAPSVSAEQLIDYWFSNDAHIDRRLLEELKIFRREGVEVHLATVQEHERARFLWEKLDLKSDFDALHYAAALGCSKPTAAFYRSVEVEAGLTPDAIFFLDDKVVNVTAARECGWTAALWTGRETVGQLIAQQQWGDS